MLRLNPFSPNAVRRRHPANARSVSIDQRQCVMLLYLLIAFEANGGRSIDTSMAHMAKNWPGRTLKWLHTQPSWAVTTGQWLAYVGVLALTIGTVVVLYGYLNGYSDYTPTGWLITTLGQMLLFLGVINMVSGGMEQSNDEVSHRIEVIGERLLRIEAATDEVLRGPRIPAERYAEGQVSESQSTRSRETADS